MSKTLVKTIGAALLTTAIALTPSCIATYPLGTKDPKPEMAYKISDEYGECTVTETGLMTNPKLRERWEKQTGRKFVPYNN